ncbi:MAG: DUF2779 domain-containing protein [Candidatus Margulisbacteria bacterium]|nr:DUF2779 domain-containing protein [Candidatus Margulisiibacteriota bacterium]
MDKPPIVLSKSKFLEGLQCPKLLWYEYNRKKDLPGIDAATQAVFDEGRRVGEWAQKLYPDGIRIERDFDPQRQSQKSIEALKLRQPLFEAGFVYNRAYALADILVPVENDAWDLVEVKSSTQLKDEHYADAAFQKYTYEGAGLKIRGCYLMHINNEYVRRGGIEPAKLFTKENITAEAEHRQKTVAQEINSMLEVIAAREMPDVKVGPQCSSPRDCQLEDICWSFLPDKDHIFILYRAGKFRYELLDRGILNIAEIPPEELNEKQALQVRSHQTGEAHIDRAALNEFLKQISYPVYFLDFETIAPAVPVYDNSRPYQEVPFQYSLDVVEKEGAEPVHYEYLAPGDVDPRPEVLKQLKERLGEAGSIIAYYAPFEIKVIKNAAEVYRDYLPWSDAVQKRFVDLLEPFKNFVYYHPGQEGSASLKRVLPAITGSSYQGLEISNGQVAAAEYYRVTFNDVDEKDRQKVRAALLKYCDLDSRGMIEVLRSLRQQAVK